MNTQLLTNKYTVQNKRVKNTAAPGDVDQSVAEKPLPKEVLLHTQSQYHQKTYPSSAVQGQKKCW